MAAWDRLSSNSIEARYNVLVQLFIAALRKKIVLSIGVSLHHQWPWFLRQLLAKKQHSPDTTTMIFHRSRTLANFSTFQISNSTWKEKKNYFKTLWNSKRMRRSTDPYPEKRHFQECFLAWKQSWIKCVSSEGEYFEGT